VPRHDPGQADYAARRGASARLFSTYAHAGGHTNILLCAPTEHSTHTRACGAGRARVAGSFKESANGSQGNAAQEGLRVHASSQVPTLKLGLPAATVVAHSRVCACMRARRVPAPLPEWLTANIRCMRARRVPAPLPGRLTATMRCLRAPRVPAPPPGRLNATMRCLRARRVPGLLPVRLTANMRCMRARRVPAPLPVRLTATMRGLRARRVPGALPGRLTANMRCMRARRVPGYTQGTRAAAKAPRGDLGSLKQGHRVYASLQGTHAAAVAVRGNNSDG